MSKENNMSRVLEILGVEETQIFRAVGYPFEYRVTPLGLMSRRDGCDWKVASSAVLMRLIDTRLQIVRTRLLTTDQTELLMVLRRHLGIRYVTMDMDGTIGLHVSLPEKRMAAWYSPDDQSLWLRPETQTLQSLVEWSNEKPFDVELALAGRLPEETIHYEEETA